jgi:spermidine/putrescine transport system permease protein
MRSVLSTQSFPMTPSLPAIETAVRPQVRGWMLMLPLLLWLGLFVIAPTAVMLLYSFCERDEIGQVVYEYSLDNYRRIFRPNPDNPWLYLQIVGRSIGWGLAAAAAVWAVVGSTTGVRAWVRHHLPLTSVQWTLLAGVGVAYWVLRDATFAITGGNYLKILLNSLELAAIVTVICVLVGYPVAYFIGKASEGSRNKLLMLVMIPFWTNFLIRTYAWITILKGEGLLNNLLLWARVINEPLPLLYTPTAVVIGMVYTYLPFMILPIYGSVEKLDNALLEAAMDLGASPIRAFSHVIVPLTRPGIIAGVLLVFVPAVGMFAINDILGGKKQPLIGNVIDQQFKQARNMPFGSALGILLLLLFAVAFFLSLRRRN